MIYSSTVTESGHFSTLDHHPIMVSAKNCKHVEGVMLCNLPSSIHQSRYLVFFFCFDLSSYSYFGHGRHLGLAHRGPSFAFSSSHRIFVTSHNNLPLP
jgi:hypothetical protein